MLLFKFFCYHLELFVTASLLSLISEPLYNHFAEGALYMSIIKRGGFVLACAFLLVLPFAFALDFLGFYSDFYGWLDFFIFFLTLSFLFEIALSTMFEGAEGKHHKFALAL